MASKHVALDMDDVVLDFVGNLVNIVNTEYGTDLKREDIDDWDLNKFLNGVVGENWWAWWERRDWLWALASAVPGAIGGIEHLRRKGWYIELITAKPRWAEAQTWRWLGKWRPPIHSVTITDVGVNKSTVTQARILVDDKPQNCIEWRDAGRRAICFNRPHNKLVPLKSKIVRVDDWQEVVREVERLEIRG